MDKETINFFNNTVSNFPLCIFSDVNLNAVLSWCGFKPYTKDNKLYYKYEFYDKRDNGFCTILLNSESISMVKYLSDVFKKINYEQPQILDSVTLQLKPEYAIDIDYIFNRIRKLLEDITVDKESIDEYNELSSIARRLDTSTIVDKVASGENVDNIDLIVRDPIYDIDQPLPNGVKKINSTKELDSILNILSDIL